MVYGATSHAVDYTEIKVQALEIDTYGYADVKNT